MLAELFSEELVRHARRLCRSYRGWTGTELLGFAPAGLESKQLARAVFEAPVGIVSHGGGEDPLFDYGNQAALDLFECDLGELLRLRSRESAAPGDRAERAALMARVREQGFAEDYSGVRVSRRGRRFRLDRATVFNVLDESGERCGQAAAIFDWTRLGT